MTRRRRPGLGHLVGAALPGVRLVQAQVAPYARAWEEANRRDEVGGGRLWVVLGDSTAQGIGAPAYDHGYVGQLRRLLDQGASGPPERDSRWRVLNLSLSGGRVTDVIADQLPRLEGLDQPPDLVTCAIGANDVYRTPAARLAEDLRTVMRRLPAGSVIATIPQGLRPTRASAVNEMIRSEAPASGLVVADVWAHTGPPWDGKLAPDHFHPGLAGYAHWARAFAEALGLDPGLDEARDPQPQS